MLTYIHGYIHTYIHTYMDTCISKLGEESLAFLALARSAHILKQQNPDHVTIPGQLHILIHTNMITYILIH